MRTQRVESLVDAVEFLVAARWQFVGAPEGLSAAFRRDETHATLCMGTESDDFPIGAEFFGFRRSPKGTRRVPMHLDDDQFRADAYDVLRRLPILPLVLHPRDIAEYSLASIAGEVRS